MGPAIHGSVTQNKVVLHTGGAKGGVAAISKICAHELAAAVAVGRDLLAGQRWMNSVPGPADPISLGMDLSAVARPLPRSGGEMEGYASQDRSRHLMTAADEIAAILSSSFPRLPGASWASTCSYTGAMCIATAN
jgi:NAD(P)-dependent dehydrogenase (short-subunit alcohol dehydrogenase family)